MSVALGNTHTMEKYQLPGITIDNMKAVSDLIEKTVIDVLYASQFGKHYLVRSRVATIQNQIAASSSAFFSLNELPTRDAIRKACYDLARKGLLQPDRSNWEVVFSLHPSLEQIARAAEAVRTSTPPPTARQDRRESQGPGRRPTGQDVLGVPAPKPAAGSLDLNDPGQIGTELA